MLDQAMMLRLAGVRSGRDLAVIRPDARETEAAALQYGDREDHEVRLVIHQHGVPIRRVSDHGQLSSVWITGWVSLTVCVTTQTR
jgi:hypothetical protein